MGIWGHAWRVGLLAQLGVARRRTDLERAGDLVGANHLDVFVRGTDGALYHRWFGSNGWNPWEGLGGFFNGDPEPVSWGSSHIDTFVVDGSNQLAHRYCCVGGWSPWSGLGGPSLVGGDIDAISWSYGRIDMFARGTGSDLQHRWFDGSQWQPWESLGVPSDG